MDVATQYGRLCRLLILAYGERSVQEPGFHRLYPRWIYVFRTAKISGETSLPGQNPVVHHEAVQSALVFPDEHRSRYLFMPKYDVKKS